MDYPGVIPMLSYEDGAAALDWLEDAFGLKRLGEAKSASPLPIGPS